MPLGLLVYISVDDNVLRFLLGIAVLIAAVMLALRDRERAALGGQRSLIACQDEADDVRPFDLVVAALHLA